MDIVVVGAGAWGSAMAIHAARHPAGHRVLLWGRDARQMAALQAGRENTRYLKGVPLPAGLSLASGPLEPLAAGADLLVLATPMAALREMLQALQGVQAPLAWLSKGFEAQSGLLAHEVCEQVAPRLRAAALSGPSFALELARGQPTALVAASRQAELREQLVQALHGGALRVYANDDLVGVEVGGAVKNVMAIATGLCDGLQLGLNARAALITRGLAEMSRLGCALGARSETFMGLSGLGDLVLTATGELSRNRKVGLLLAQGLALPEVLASLGHVSEGAYSARTVLERARAHGVDMPITQAVVGLLDGRLQAHEAVAHLMERDPRQE
ncbi:NAD(P)H-dependent glycerol-3-phosphate dehydrogenase [Comamonas sp. NLF-1-9]|uniref:NAD(P)H-dependent glycerol-3-phosphate dehydrogenase n=1 Tax=Comamonas sp. NLF-1-9 TaxID=2853163 RepID=UPI001C458CCC|nr:NAD(P)H-dependent glycerol-3-phosphate dehydrogenase [Comamonas sp. NLF-1-9]QXL83136.1 NAD(P)-dependent glycerol-3-phosphate dehydrogenase [Comamonas sp. NLF-1-9]